MAIEETYRSLLGAQRKRQKREERQDMLLQAGTLATNIYQQKLDEKAQEFFDRTEVADQRIKYQEGYDLYNNKIKKIYDEGTQSTLGLGEYLVGNIAQPIAQERIYANFDEDMVSDPDELGSAVRSYAEEMVYGGLDAQGNRIGGGMLDKLQAAYDSGKTLKSMDKYDEYISRRADLPENVGMALVGRFFNGKSRQEVEADALQRIATNNQFDENSAAFMALAKAFDSGMSLTNSEKVAKKVEAYTKDIGMKPLETLQSSELVDTTSYAGDKEIKWKYRVNTYVNSKTGATRTESVANTANPKDEALFKKQEYSLQMAGPEQEKIHPISGGSVKFTPYVIYHISGSKAGTVSEVSEYVGPDRATLEMEVGQNNISAARSTVQDILYKANNQKLFDQFDKHVKRSIGKDADDQTRDNYIAAFDANVFKLAYNIQQQSDGLVDGPTALKISAQIALNNVAYSEEVDDVMGSYQGANLAASTEVNGLRILEALNDLTLADPEFKLPKEFASYARDYLYDNQSMKAFTGRTSAKQGFEENAEIFDKASRDYFFKKALSTRSNSTRSLFFRYEADGESLYNYIARIAGYPPIPTQSETEGLEGEVNRAMSLPYRGMAIELQ